MSSGSTAMQPAKEEKSSSIQHESRNCSIPSGDNSVWADVSPLLSVACSGMLSLSLVLTHTLYDFTSLYIKNWKLRQGLW